jgi:hypothetical protein
MEGTHGEAAFRQACAMGLEGIVAKRRDRPYRSGRSPDWIEVKKPGRAAHQSGARPPVLGIVDGDSRHGTTYQGQLRTTATEVKNAADTITAIKKTFGIEEPIKEPPRAYTMMLIARAVCPVGDTIALVSPGGLSGRFSPRQQLRTPRRQLTWPIGLAHRAIGTAWP